MSFDRGTRTYELSDERLREFGALTPAQRLDWVEQCSQFLRLARLSGQAGQGPAAPEMVEKSARAG